MIDLPLWKFTSAYPAQTDEMNLLTIPHLVNAFGVLADLFDHTLGVAVSVAANALGACITEKHFTLSRDTPGPDSVFSEVNVHSVRSGRVLHTWHLDDALSRYAVKDIDRGTTLQWDLVA